MSKFDLITLGEVLLRFSPQKNERLTKASILNMQAVGSELNVASGVSMLGLNTSIISKLSKNELGTFAKDSIRSYGVDDSLIIPDFSPNARMGTYYYEYGAYPRKPNVIYDRKNSSFTNLNIDEINTSIFNLTRAFHTSGITLALCKNCEETATQIIKKFKENGALISFDVNYRANLWTEEEAKRSIEAILPYVDILFCSKFTANHMFNIQGDIHNIMKEFCNKYGIKIMASTNRVVHSPKSHSFSSILYSLNKDSFYEESPYENIDVIDRIGSGDAYVSGVLFGLLNYDLSLENALEIGNATSALKNTIAGDLLSTNFEEIKSIIREHKAGKSNIEMNR